MNKIEKIYNIIKNRMSGYIAPIKVYKNTHTLLKAYCKIDHKNYYKIVNYYTEYFKSHRYMNTKYAGRNKKNCDAFDIVALATNPISISGNRMLKKNKAKIAFALLHEIGHYKVGDNEIAADKFAIRWIRTLKKEKLIE